MRPNCFDVTLLTLVLFYAALCGAPVRAAPPESHQALFAELREHSTVLGGVSRPGVSGSHASGVSS